MKLKKWYLTVPLLAVAGVAVMAAEPSPAPPAYKAANIKEGFTLPFKRYEINFNAMGIVREVKVKEGDVVKKGDVLLVQDDTEEQAELAILEFDANNKLPIKAAEANMEAKKWEFEAKERLWKIDHGNDLEYYKAKAELEIARIQIDQAKMELDQKALKRDKQKAHVDRMKLVAMRDGVVLKLNSDLGANAGVDPKQPAIVLLENNPLTVEVQVPALASLQLKLGDKMRVSYDKKDWREAKVSFLSPQANAGAAIRVIHLEFENTNNDPSGLPVYVELPDKLMVAQDGR